jgi:exodeoxyribonuclease V beta subunit
VSAPNRFNLAETPLKRGTSLIEASAGTGKTYAITALFVRLIVEENLSVREILVVTYTVAATEELRHRVRQALVQALQGFASGASDIPFLKTLVDKYRENAPEMAARLQNALWDFDEAPIYTIHGFCQRTLRDRAFESGVLFDTELVTDLSDFLQEIADDFWRKHFYEAGSTLVNFALKNKCGPNWFIGLLRTCLSYPQIEFISQAKGHSLESLSAELENGYKLARNLWLSEGAAIKACFGSATKWGNAPYNKDEKMAPLFEQLDRCFSESETAFESFGALASFCNTALEENKFKKAKELVPQHHFFEQCEKLSKTERLWLAGLQLALVDYAGQEMPRRKAEQKIQYYDDLLTRLNNALAGPAGKSLGESLQDRYKAALIDEFQDTDPVQYQVFRRAFSGEQTFLFLIGDPKQAIYGFRGADIFTYLEAAGEATGRFTLGENWRSESGLVTAVNKIFSAAPQAFVFDRIGFQEVVSKGQADKAPLLSSGKAEPPFQFWFWKRNGLKEISKALATKILPRVVASEIVGLLNGDVKIGERKLKPEDIAVLVLENSQAAKVQEALSEFNVPSVLHTTASLFQSPEAFELQRVLSGIALPGDERLVKSALATDLFGVDGCRLAACSESQWQDWLQRFHEYLELWDGRGFFRMFRRWLQAEQVRQRLLAFPDGERRLTNVLHLGEVLHQAETERRFGIGGVLKWFAEQVNSNEEAPEEHQLRLERDENAVRLVTVHKSKGLEYPVVFSVFSWKGSEITRYHEEQVFFHDPEKQLQLVRDLGPEIDEEHRQLAKQEKLAENVRLLYVALTRAKHRCHFVWGGIKGAGTSAPAWLFHRPAMTGEPLLDSLEANFKSLSDPQMLQELETVSKSSSGAIQISDLPEAAIDLYQPQDTDGFKLECREFKGRIQRDWVISSFTYLTAGISEEQPDRDKVSPVREEEAQGEGIFAFPRGTKAGTCLHDIIERLNFSSDDEGISKLVTERLPAHDLAQSGHVEAVSQMLKNLLKFALAIDRPDFNLAQIPATERLNELEFYFPVQGISPARLHDFLGKSGWSSAVPVQLGRLAFDPIKGFLKGFIDLVFRFDNKFYVVDWKSNWLGNRVEDYSPAAIKDEMRRHHYFVQYHLYTVALHKYLSLRVPGYEYEKQFGGVIYLFLRGLDPARPEYGVYRDRPSLDCVEQLSALLEDK